MCPPAVVPSPADSSLYWTDEEIFMCLDKLERGSPLPSNVTADKNPYKCMPSELPDGIWYIVYPESKKDTKLGFWKARGEACELFKNSDIFGWRTTLEFYEGQAPHGQRTEWVMHEYKITQKELCHNSAQKDSKSLCRVFCTNGQNVHQELHSKHGTIYGAYHSHSMPVDIIKADSNTREGSTIACQVKNRDDETGFVAVAERLPDPPVENLLEELLDILTGDYLELDNLADPRGDYLERDDLANPRGDYLEWDDLANPRGDYLEWDDLADPRGDYLALEDLADPASSSSSSNNSSCVSSEDCFDVSSPVRSNEVVLLPATLGSPSSGNKSKFPMESTLSSSSEEKFLDERAIKHAGKRQRQSDLNGAPSSSNRSSPEEKFLDGRTLKHAGKRQRQRQSGLSGTPSSINFTESSRSTQSVSEGQANPPSGRIKKLKKKFLCFMPF